MSQVITITLKTPEEVQDELKARLPDIANAGAITVEGDKTPWVWFKTEKKPDDASRGALKEIGFSFSGRRSAWYHTCMTDTTRRRFGGRTGGGGSGKQATPQPRIVQAVKAAAHTVDYDSEFKRRFG